MEALQVSTFPRVSATQVTGGLQAITVPGSGVVAAAQAPSIDLNSIINLMMIMMIMKVMMGAMSSMGGN